MNYREREIGFEEADRRYAELKRQLGAGSISTEEFDAQRKQLMVQDEKGSWWAKGREDGDWYYRGEAGWVKGTPPDYQPPPQTTSPDSTPTSDRNGGIAQTRAATPLPAAREAYERLRKLPWVPILLPLLLLLVLLGSAYALTRGTNENVEVTDLVGASSVEEAQRIAGGDLEVVEGDGVESQEPIGTVVGQDPAAGETAVEGSTISVDVSKGVSLPDVRGETREEAVRILERAGFEVEEETEESSAENEGSVTEQDPRGGKTAEAGSSVTITVGAGAADVEAKTDSPEPEPVSPEPKQTPAPEQTPAPKQTPVPEQTPAPVQLPVPDVVGKNVEEAKQTIQNAGFAFAVETVQSNQPAGTVISTDPAPGTLLDPASREVIIRQSSGPPPPASNKGADTKTKGGDEKAKGGAGTGKENN
jgi:eukaryotic-like serine/threonine-protein kinase